MPRQPKRAKSFSFDLLADWSAVATPLDAQDVHRGWVLHGTATLNGEAGALAFRGGWYGIKVGSLQVRELDMWERFDVSHGIKFETAQGCEGVPKFETNLGENYDFAAMKLPSKHVPRKY